MTKEKLSSSEKLDKIVADAHRNRDKREAGYREKSLKMYPWICGRCSREFNQDTVRELTVHHRNHNHDDNPEDGSNWELLCVYCHDNEHSRLIDNEFSSSNKEEANTKEATNNPFAGLAGLIKDKSKYHILLGPHALNIAKNMTCIKAVVQ